MHGPAVQLGENRRDFPEDLSVAFDGIIEPWRVDQKNSLVFVERARVELHLSGVWFTTRKVSLVEVWDGWL